MRKKLFAKKAQTTLEYAILIGVIVAGLIAMQVYVKRGYQGKLRESADSMGQQFSPGETAVHYNTTSLTNSTDTLDTNRVSKTDIHKQTSTRKGNESVANFSTENWFDKDWDNIVDQGN
ncbi:MAG: hypothetical protein WC628_00795 [Candidatus Omnitrophota bacterium]